MSTSASGVTLSIFVVEILMTYVEGSKEDSFEIDDYTLMYKISPNYVYQLGLGT